MIDVDTLLPYYSPQIVEKKIFHKYILKEYIELLALEHLFQSQYAPKLVFIGGTCLRLVYGIDRFSEDLDFDCKDLDEKGFIEMTDSVVHFLRLNGLRVELRDKDNPKLTAFRRNIFFPELLFDLRLTGHREERFLMKIEAQDQGVQYDTQSVMVNRNGFFFPITIPTKGVLLSMKIAAILSRAKGRDFYDTIFLWQQTEPDIHFLKQRCGIDNYETLKNAMYDKLNTIDFAVKQRDFEHLLFNPSRSSQVLYFQQFLNGKFC